MSDNIYEDWKTYKASLKESIEVTIERKRVNQEVLEIMLQMLENVKIKPKIQRHK